MYTYGPGNRAATLGVPIVVNALGIPTCSPKGPCQTEWRGAHSAYALSTGGAAYTGMRCVSDALSARRASSMLHMRQLRHELRTRRLPNALHTRCAPSWRIWWAVGGTACSLVFAGYSPSIRRVYAQPHAGLVPERPASERERRGSENSIIIATANPITESIGSSIYPYVDY